MAIFPLVAGVLALASLISGDDQKNVLLIVVDDGGFQSPVYGNTHVDTPNLETLAKRSLVFKRGYTSVSSCSPSRSAILTGEYYSYCHYFYFFLVDIIGAKSIAQ